MDDQKPLTDMDPDHCVVKLDLSNAFNSIRRDRMLEAVRDHAPSIYPFPSVLHT